MHVHKFLDPVKKIFLKFPPTYCGLQQPCIKSNVHIKAYFQKWQGVHFIRYFFVWFVCFYFTIGFDSKQWFCFNFVGQIVPFWFMELCKINDEINYFMLFFKKIITYNFWIITFFDWSIPFWNFCTKIIELWSEKWVLWVSSWSTKSLESTRLEIKTRLFVDQELTLCRKKEDSNLKKYRTRTAILPFINILFHFSKKFIWSFKLISIFKLGGLKKHV